LLDAPLAPEQALFMLIVVAGFTKFPFFHDACFGSFPFNPACLTKGFAPFFCRPFPDGLALAYFPALACLSIRSSKNVVDRFMEIPLCVHSPREQKV
jgi:hypothetical protein